MSEKVKLVVCNEPQNCGTVKELEAEYQKAKVSLNSIGKWYKRIRYYKDGAMKIPDPIEVGVALGVDKPEMLQYASDTPNLLEKIKEWDDERVPRLSLVGELIRGDWSGTEFDGRDVRDWIGLILDGKYDEFDEEVKSIAEDSVLYAEIIKQKEKTQND